MLAIIKKLPNLLRVHAMKLVMERNEVPVVILESLFFFHSYSYSVLKYCETLYLLFAIHLVPNKKC